MASMPKLIIIDPHNNLPALLNHQRSAILTILAAVVLAIADGLHVHHVDWSAVGYAALVAFAGICRSALVPRTDAPSSVSAAVTAITQDPPTGPPTGTVT